MTCLSVQALWIPDAAVEPVVLREDAEWQPVNQHSGRGTFNLKRETTARELAAVSHIRPVSRGFSGVGYVWLALQHTVVDYSEVG